MNINGNFSCEGILKHRKFEDVLCFLFFMNSDEDISH
jgi:hypothetical protein